MTGAQGRRLRLTGSEVNTLCRLELLQKDVKSRQQEQQPREGEEMALEKLGVFLDEMLA